MKKIIIVLLALLLCACSTKPTYYNSNEVEQYAKEVFTNVTYVSKEGNEDDGYAYTYKRADGIEFHIYTGSYRIGIDATETMFYGKEISDDYLYSIYKANIDTINSYVESTNLDYKESVDDGDLYYSDIHVYLTSLDELKEVYELYKKIDDLLNYQYDYSNASISTYNSYKGIMIYLKPLDSFIASQGDYNWKEDDNNDVSRLLFSHNENSKLDYDEAYSQVEKAVVDLIKEKDEQRYELSDDILYKYPAKYLSTNINTGNYEFNFAYNDTLETYIISTLDPCQDYDGFAYNYLNPGKFKELVEYLGGTYTCDQNQATWTINGHTYNAVLKVDSEEEYVDFICKKDGKELSLSEVVMNNGTVSGRDFSIEDLEKMLGITIEIDQKEEIAYFGGK